MDQAGYSGTPLHKKLGIAENIRVDALTAPSHYEQLLSGISASVTIVRDEPFPEAVFIHLFVKTRQELDSKAPMVVANLRKGGTL